MVVWTLNVFKVFTLITWTVWHRRLIVSGLLPRATVSVDLEPYNKQLKLSCEENHIDFINNYDIFLLAFGEQPAT